MFRYVVSSLVVLALAIWIGSLTFFGAVVAPVIFDAAVIVSRTEAGEINAAILSRLGLIEAIASVIVAGGAIYGVYRTRNWLSWGVLVLSVGMAITSYYYNDILFPRMNELRVAIGSFDTIANEKRALKAEFDQSHATYSMLVKLVLGSGLIALVLHSSSLVNFRLRTYSHGWLADNGPIPEHRQREDPQLENGAPTTPGPLASKGEG